MYIPPLNNVRMPEKILKEYGTSITPLEPISMASFMNLPISNTNITASQIVEAIP
jgi:hypothetical protein